MPPALVSMSSSPPLIETVPPVLPVMLSAVPLVVSIFLEPPDRVRLLVPVELPEKLIALVAAELIVTLPWRATARFPDALVMSISPPVWAAAPVIEVAPVTVKLPLTVLRSIAPLPAPLLLLVEVALVRVMSILLPVDVDDLAGWRFRHC